MLEKLAPAKINLVLEVLGKRDDGYHEIKSVMQTINICDKIILEPDYSLSLNCNLPEIQNKENLVYRAALLLKKSMGLKKGVKITLEKQIPAGAGLGGGSSDAANTLISLNKFWKLNLDTFYLLKLAGELGSDVPFFIYGGTGMIEGRGEIVTSLKCLHKLWYVICVPDIKIDNKTRVMYSLLNKEHFSSGKYSTKILETLRLKKNISTSMFFNVFDSVGLKAFTELKRIWDTLEATGFKHPHLSGSGPAIFCAFNSEDEAKNLYLAVRKSGINSFIAETFS